MGISPDAVAGFVGVVTGGVMTGGFQLGMTVRTEWRDRRAARRTVRNELLHALALVDYAMTEGRGWKFVSDVRTDAWEKHADDLARDRKLKFGTVAGAYRAIEGLLAVVPRVPESEFAVLAAKTIRDAVNDLDDDSALRAPPE